MNSATQTLEAIDYLHTPEALQENVFERQGCPIHYWTGGRGDRPAIACLHGALMDHRMFNAQVPALIEEYRFVTWDARGHGISQPIALSRPTLQDYTEDALAMLDHAGIEKTILVGQSMGGYVAQHLVKNHPERVLTLVVIGSTPIAFALNRMEFWALQASSSLFRLWPYRSLKPLMARNTAMKEDVIRYAQAAMDQVDLATFLSIWKAVGTAVRREGYPDFRIEAPFLLTHGDNDKTGTIRRDGPRWAASDERIEYVVIPGAGHNANQDNWLFFNRVLVDFLKRRAP